MAQAIYKAGSFQRSINFDGKKADFAGTKTTN